jgi:hypothetical protein
VFGPKARDNEDVRGMLNAGHRKGAVAGRCVPRGNSIETEEFPAYCAVALAGLKDLPDTIASRSIIIPMRPRTASESIEPWRDRVNGPEARELGRLLAEWMSKADIAIPHDMPVTDRAADVWEALVAVADAAGGLWPARAREAAVAFDADARNASPTMGGQLLGDLREVFGSKDKMGSADIIDALVKLPESPWYHYHPSGSSLNTRDLSRLLKQYGVNSRDVWIDGKSVKGYLANDLADPWTRYRP